MDSIIKRTPGEKLEDLLKERKISHKALAQAVGVSESMISDFTNSDKTRKINAYTIVDICRYLNISIDWLFSNSTDSNYNQKLIDCAQFTGLDEKAILRLRQEVDKNPDFQNFQLSIEEYQGEKVLIEIINRLLTTKSGISFLWELDGYINGEFNDLKFNDANGKEISVTLPLHCSRGRKASAYYIDRNTLENDKLEDLKTMIKRIKEGDK